MIDRAHIAKRYQMRRLDESRRYESKSLPDRPIDENIKQGGKILILTIADESYRAIEEISTPNKQAYARKHGYDFEIVRNLPDKSRQAVWNKIPALKKSLPKYEWAFYTDADSLITNSDIKLESFIDDKYPIILNKDDNGINFGQFFMRNCGDALRFLNEIYNRTDFLNHHWKEQAAVCAIYPRWQDKIKLVSSKEFNAHPWWGSNVWEPGDFMLHFSGFFSGASQSSLDKVMGMMAKVAK